MKHMLHNIVFPSGPCSPRSSDWILLALRVVFGTFLLVHGIQKIMDYGTLSSTFPDPIGLGSRISLQLAIFAEFLCSLGVITGFLFRLSLIPVMFTMCVAAFVVLGGAPWGQRELPVSYLMVFAIMFISGPGRISLDALVGRKSRRQV